MTMARPVMTPRPLVLVGWIALAALQPSSAHAQVRAHVPAGIKPAWNKGIQPISRESYWSAVECGKQGGARPACVFYDTDLCKNDDFTLALYTPYKKVAYEVWLAVTKKQDPPTPSYTEAQRTRIVVGITPQHRSENPITAVAIKRSGGVVKPASQTLDSGGGTFIFDFAALAPTADVTLELVGRARTRTCLIDRTVLGRLR